MDLQSLQYIRSHELEFLSIQCRHIKKKKKKTEPAKLLYTYTFERSTYTIEKVS